MTDERTRVIHEWMQAKQAAAAWTAREQELRLFIAAQGWGYNRAVEGSVPDGTHRLDLGNGFALKLVTGTDWSIKNGPELDTALATIRQMTGGYVILDKALKHNYSLLKRGYDAAPAEVKALLSRAIEVKNKMPTLELEEPK